jgi:hypothetical protein
MKSASPAEIGNDGMVAELQGLYGPFSFPERLLQQIWSRRDFDETAALTVDGQKIRIIHAGRWNRLGGPDFKDARMLIGDREVTGDVELHVHMRDWNAHGHAMDSAYANVVLHVVLFPDHHAKTFGAGGCEIPVLSLLPVLHHDLEAYAADDAVEHLSQHPLARANVELSIMTLPVLRDELKRQALRRWSQKVHFARLRLQRLGWDEACHHVALEVLGYRFNRAPMLAVAGAYPLSAWANNSGEGSVAGRAYDGFGDRWTLQGSRPANHPRARLLQYEAWTSAAPNWPLKLADSVRSWVAVQKSIENDAMTVAEMRRSQDLVVLRRKLGLEVCGNAIGGTRLDTLICDGFLPLLAARTDSTGKMLQRLWLNWLPGDFPEKHGRLLRNLGVVGDRGWPASHGMLQGLLGWLIMQEQRQSVGSLPETGEGLDKIFARKLF